MPIHHVFGTLRISVASSGTSDAIAVTRLRTTMVVRSASVSARAMISNAYPYPAAKYHGRAACGIAQASTATASSVPVAASTAIPGIDQVIMMVPARMTWAPTSSAFRCFEKRSNRDTAANAPTTSTPALLALGGSQKPLETRATPGDLPPRARARCRLRTAGKEGEGDARETRSWVRP